MKKLACLVVLVVGMGCSQDTKAIKNETVTERPPRPSFGEPADSGTGAEGSAAGAELQ